MTERSTPTRIVAALALTGGLALAMMMVAAPFVGVWSLVGAIAFLPLGFAAHQALRLRHTLERAVIACRIADRDARAIPADAFAGCDDLDGLLPAFERLVRHRTRSNDDLRPRLDEMIRVCHAAANGDLERRIAGADADHGPVGDLVRAINRQLDVCEVFVREAAAAMEALADDRLDRPVGKVQLSGAYGDALADMTVAFARFAGDKDERLNRGDADARIFAVIQRDLERALIALSAAPELTGTSTVKLGGLPPATREARTAMMLSMARVLGDRAVALRASLTELAGALAAGTDLPRRPRRTTGGNSPVRRAA
ncbi:MAG: hypothetical protein KDJ16_11060 [Hyphomicrobiales bacterium]|nr:hypothetical protein [Hyphomicrobiales bacterium]